MRIERIAIDKFGGLRGFEKEFGAGLTVIYGGNESYFRERYAIGIV